MQGLNILWLALAVVITSWEGAHGEPKRKYLTVKRGMDIDVFSRVPCDSAPRFVRRSVGWAVCLSVTFHFFTFSRFLFFHLTDPAQII